MIFGNICSSEFQVFEVHKCFACLGHMKYSTYIPEVNSVITWSVVNAMQISPTHNHICDVRISWVSLLKILLWIQVFVLHMT